MKHLKIAGLCLVSMLMMGMALAGSASAAPLWLLCLPRAAGTGAFEDASCRFFLTNGNWESESNGTKTDKITILALTLTLTDEKTALGSTPVRCDHPSKSGMNGFIGPGNKGLITEAKVVNAETECESLGGACKTGEKGIKKVEGVNLPWQTEIFESEGRFETKIESTFSTEHEPGWAVTCETLLGEKTDTCTTESKAKDEVLGLASRESTLRELLVLGTFLRAYRAHCTEGGKESGLAEGMLGILLAKANGEPSGLGLSVEE
jgi:hypothetical protein